MSARESLRAIFMILVPALVACGESAPPQDAAPAERSREPRAAPAATEPETTSQTAGMITARSLLEPALAEARLWQADAVLIGVTTSLADGPAHGFWFYDVQSPDQGTCTRIRAMANGSIQNVGTGDSCVLMKPVSVEFVDSPVAYAAAEGAGFEKGESVEFGLRFQRDQALPEPRECWVISSDTDGIEETGVTRGWCVDPVTGAFVTRLSGYGRTEPLS